jgi:hypothetical protein
MVIGAYVAAEMKGNCPAIKVPSPSLTFFRVLCLPLSSFLTRDSLFVISLFSKEETYVLV